VSEIHDDPFREAAHAVVGLANELANIIMATQSLQLRLIGLKPDKDAPVAPDAPEPKPEVAIDPRAGQAVARFAWEPALREEWLATANPVETARVWAAALPFANHDATAAEAMLRSESRLEEIHPEAMAQYHELRAQGHDPAEAMLAAAPTFDQPTTGTGTGGGADELAVRPALRTGAGNVALAHELALDNPLALDAPHSVLVHGHGARATSRLTASTSAPAATGVPSHRTSSSQTTTHDGVVEADEAAPDVIGAEAPAAGARAEAAAEAFENLAQEELGLAKGANAQPDLAATPAVDEHILGEEAGARHTARADSLHARAADASPAPLPPEAARAAEIAMRTFPTAHEAVDRIPRPRTPSPGPKPKKVLSKILKRGR
jgi:hypothetical protein